MERYLPEIKSDHQGIRITCRSCGASRAVEKGGVGVTQASHLFTETISFAEPTGLGNSGDRTFGAVTTAAARVEHGSFLVRGTDGNMREFKTLVITETAISSAARVWLPGDDTTDGNESKKISGRSQFSTPEADVTFYELIL